MPMSRCVLSGLLLLVLAAVPLAQRHASPDAGDGPAQEAGPRPARSGAGAATPARPPAASFVPDLASLTGRDASELRAVVERFTSDRAALLRRDAVEYSAARRGRLRDFYGAWRQRLAALPFDTLGLQGKVDHVLLAGRLAYELKLLDREEQLFAEVKPVLPFAEAIIALIEARRAMEPVDPEAAAAALDRMRGDVRAARERLEADPKPSRHVALRAAGILNGLGRTLEQWFRYYDGYDPLFSWWVRAPYGRVKAELDAYEKMLREKIVGYKAGEDEPIVGDPIGTASILEDLAYEMIPYTPEQLVAIAEKEFAWCEAEMRKASRAMGFGDDWRQALEKVKTLHVPPGRQPDLIRDQAFEAIEFLERRDLVTVPPLARDIWRIEMMSPERQKVNPFFLGGEVIQVSYPTDTMDHEDKLMSMRGNNIHFARATVHHELIPGHHLQGFMTERYSPHRRAFATPFWGEGWALYWEMLLWDLDFPRSAEDRVGMLFWRMHRAARIIFSLSFHLGRMTPQECIDFLVERVGHERANAEAEVRRSFNGSYSPLYQVAYMIGGLQFRTLHRELVQSGRMTNRTFHDTILQNGRMPVEMVRAVLLNQAPARDHKASWRFYPGL
jgi:hypothetical protein